MAVPRRQETGFLALASYANYRFRPRVEQLVCRHLHIVLSSLPIANHRSACGSNHIDRQAILLCIISLGSIYTFLLFRWTEDVGAVLSWETGRVKRQRRERKEMGYMRGLAAWCGARSRL